jgi:hypothetical protein
LAEVEFTNDPETGEAISDAISGIMRERRGDMLLKLIVIAEIMDADGDRGIWTCTAGDLATWDERGLLGYALDRVRDVDLLRRMDHDA